MDNAIDHFSKAEETKPDNADQQSLYERQGEAYGKLQRLGEAKEPYRSAVEHSSSKVERAVALDGDRV